MVKTDSQGKSKSEEPAWRNPLKRLRPSQLILLSVLPFVIYLFVSSMGYQSAMRFIFGVEENSLRAFISFFLLLVGLSTGIYLSLSLLRRDSNTGGTKGWHFILYAVYLLFIFLAFRVDSQFTIFSLPVRLANRIIFYGVFAAVLTPIALFAPRNQRFARMAATFSLIINIIPLVWLVFFANLGFASGILVTIRVAIFAYLSSSILGITLAGLLLLGLGEKTLQRFLIAGLVLSLASIFFFTRPMQNYTLVGSLDGRVAIINGTPDRVSDQIKARSFLENVNPEESSLQVRGVSDAATALSRIQEGTVTAAFVPTEQAPADLPKLWQTTFLPDSARNPAILLLTFGIFLLLLTLGGWNSGHHPLAVFAELYVDLMRGIPMLVIILYVGFPIIGAIRDATGGAIDIPLLVRGVIGISLGYAAYMAEIFRAGIQAIPKGQYEASRSLGLSGWQTARFIILPQALKIVIPPLGNEFIAMVKDTSLLSVLSVRDITQRAREFSSATFQTFPPFNTVAILYVILTLAASSLVKYVERRTDTQKR